MKRVLFLQILAIAFFSCLLFAGTASAISVVATVTVGSEPAGVAYDSVKGEIFVANAVTGTVSVISDVSNTVIATVTGGSTPNGVAYDSAKGEIFVANNGGGTVSVISDASNTVIATVTVGSNPNGIAYDSAKGEIFVANGAGTVSVIRDSDNTVVATVTVGSTPEGVAYDSAKGEIFVANSGVGTVSVISDGSNTYPAGTCGNPSPSTCTNSVVATVTGGSTPFGVAYDSAKGEIFVVNSGGGTVSVISDVSNTVIATVTVGSVPRGVAYDSAKGEIFVANNGANTVSVISDSTNTVISGGAVTVGSGPFGVAYDSGMQEIFVTNSGADTVSVISDPVASSSSGGHDVTIYRPPSLGNDYTHQYGGGITINGKPFDIENYTTTIPPQVLQIGTPATFDFKIYDNRGAYTISHVGMYFHFKGDPSVINSDTWLSWDKTKGVDFHDPDKIFSKASVDVKAEGSYFYVTFTLTPQKTMPDSSLIMRMWDDKLVSGDVPIWGAIVIVDPNAPVPVKKIPTDQYGDYITLENILDKDGYYIPWLLNKLHALDDTDKSVDINWVYDKGVDKLTMVESDKSGNILGEIVSNLDKKRVTQPTVTDHSQSQTTWTIENIFHPQNTQLNRADPAQEHAAMSEEAQKAKKILESMQVLRVDYIPKITLSATANSILDAFRDAEPSQLYIYDPIKEQESKKLDEYKADKILESMGVKLEAYAWR